MYSTYDLRVCVQICFQSEYPDSPGVDDADSINLPRLTSPITTGANGLTVLYRGNRGLVSPETVLHRDTWDSVLCAGVPVSLRELVLFMTDHLGLQADITNAQKLLVCSWSLGWHVKARSRDGLTVQYWGGGVTPETSSRYLRGDWIEIEGTDTRFGVPTSRLTRVICGVRINKVTRSIRDELPDMSWETVRNKRTGAETFHKTFLLVGFAVGHRSSGRNRGPNHRPLCPGILQDTHCLWSWAQRKPTYQRGCFRGRAWDRNKRLFGDTRESQDIRKDLEARAWYDLISCDRIIGHTNVQVDPDREYTFLQSVMWC